MEEIHVRAEQLAAVESTYESGRYLAAWEMASRLGPIRRWVGIEARLLAGRLAGNLGAPRLAAALHELAWRQAPEDPQALLYRARSVLTRRGAFFAWRFLRAHPPSNAWPDDIRAQHSSLEAEVMAAFRDFDFAEERLLEAERLDPEDPWIRVVHASVWEQADRYREALELTDRTLASKPWYRPAVQERAHLLTLLDRRPEALAFLREAMTHLESTAVAYQLAILELELERSGEAIATLERCEALAPLAESGYLEGIAARLMDAWHRCGDRDRAAAAAERIPKNEYYRTAAMVLRDPTLTPKRVHLPVSFVRQHYVTCVPATLAALSRFWKRPVDHLEVAERICYDGTPEHEEREWGLSNGWVVREFTVTRAAAEALLDAGVPFTLSTSGPGNAHMQAVVGYDRLLGTFLIRDPYLPFLYEMPADGLLERNAPTGPRGSAFLPSEEAGRLEGVVLPDAVVYDLFDEVRVALARHDRTRALAAVDQLEARHPGHRLAIEARRRLAGYDGDHAAILRQVELLLETGPDAPLWLAGRLYALRELGRRGEALDLLRRAVERTGADPYFYRELARELSQDARQARTSESWLRRSLRAQPADSENLSLLAWRWQQTDVLRDASLELRRLAACVDPLVEGMSDGYFHACRQMGRAEEGIAFLRRRVERLGSRSGAPVVTLAQALDFLERPAEASSLVEEALRKRPDDAVLLLESARLLANAGRDAEAQEAVARAEGKGVRRSWLEAAARLAERGGRRAEATEHWREIARLEPTSVNAHHAVARLVEESQGRASAMEYLAGVAGQWPHHLGINQLRAEWSRADPPAQRIAVLDPWLETQPDDAWALRERALVHLAAGRFQDALRDATAALDIEPWRTESWSIRAQVRCRLEDRDGAGEDFRRALQISVDNGWAMHGFIWLHEERSKRLAAIDEVREELRRQTISGDALDAFSSAVTGLLEPDALLEILREARAARPELWQSWSALIGQLSSQHRHDEALREADEMSKRFPFLPRAWLDLGNARVAGSRLVEAAAAFGRALELSPGWTMAAMRRAECLERTGELAAAEAVLTRALQLDPRSAPLRGWLADLYWRTERRDAAERELRIAAESDPSYGWGWETLRAWSSALGRPELVPNAARQLTRNRPGDARAWMLLARMLEAPGAEPERMAAVDRAIELNPGLEDAYDLRAVLFYESGDFQAAMAACRPPGWPGRRPVSLVAREAWLLHESGRLPEAVSLMQEALGRDETYSWGWRCLALWHRETEEYEEAIAAAGRLIRLEPRDADGYALRARSNALAERRAEAKSDWEMSLQLNVWNVGIARELFAARIADREFQYLGPWLERMAPVLPPVDHAAFQAHLAAERGDRTAALAHLRRLGGFPEATGEIAAPAFQALLRTGWQRGIQAKLRKIVQGSVSEEFGWAWTSPWAKPLLAKHVGELRRFTGATAGERGALRGALERAGDDGEKAVLRRLLRRHRKAIRGDSALWGAFTYAAVCCSLFRKSLAVVDDWQVREGVRPWMLHNVATLLRCAGRHDEAGRACRRALSLPGFDTMRPELQHWAAWHDALEGRGEDASRGLQAAGEPEGNTRSQLLRLWIRGLSSVQEAAPDARAAAARLALEQVRRDTRPFWPIIPGCLAAAYRTTLKRVCAAGGIRCAPWIGWAPTLRAFAKPDFELPWPLYLIFAVAVLTQVLRSCWRP